MTDGLTVLRLSELEGEILGYADNIFKMFSDGFDANSIYEYVDDLAWTIIRRYDELFSEAYLMGKKDTIEQYEKDYPEKARNEECFVYFITDGNYLKIGVSKDVERRIKQLQTAHGNKLKLIRKVKCQTRDSAFKSEKWLHDMFSLYQTDNDNKSSEWFEIAVLRNVMELSDREIIRCKIRKTSKKEN